VAVPLFAHFRYFFFLTAYAVALKGMLMILSGSFEIQSGSIVSDGIDSSRNVAEDIVFLAVEYIDLYPR
jgi:hypothetical protein